MLFNSYEFIFLYLPAVFCGYFFIAPRSHRLAALWLVTTSVFFYGWWNPKFISLLLASIIFNYGAGYLIGHARITGRSKGLLVGALAANLLLLGLFKYANFFITTANSAGAHISLLNIVLPLGISFFTFTQIAFLMDVHRGIACEYSFIHYILFVTWFPHLIAGPVLHHKQMMPQFAHPETYRPNPESIAVGLTLFSLGLFKKIMLADQFALFADPVFDVVAGGGRPMLFEAWIGALAYTLQIYFDFSGYSDMAIGLSRIFNIKLPLNFNSPYKAINIIDFWRRWHMTLSAFLRDYIYIPLGGNRKGPLRHYINVIMTMLLAGLWHGAGWNFVLWGGLHGVYLVINHGWHNLVVCDSSPGARWTRFASILLTFTAVVIAWVPFRAANYDATLAMLGGMVGINGVSLPQILEPYLASLLGNSLSFSGFVPITRLETIEIIAWLPLGLAIVWLFPNTQQWLSNYAPAGDVVISQSRLAWHPSRTFAVIIGMLFAVSVLVFKKNNPFLYFQF